MEVEMGQAVTGTKGTTFICEEKDGISTLKVLEGIVELTSKVDGESIMVSGGEMISASSDGLGQRTDFNIDKELESWDENVKEMTAQVLPDREKSFSFGWIIIMILIIFMILTGGALAIFFIKNKRKKAGSYSLGKEPSNTHKHAQASNLKKDVIKFCHNCGSPILENTEFCINCGQRLW